MKSELTVQEEQQLRKLLIDTSADFESVMQIIRQADESNSLAINLVLHLYSLEEILRCSYRPGDYRPLDEKWMNRIRSIFFMIYKQFDHEQQNDIWKEVMSKIKVKVRNIRSQNKR